jgi:hypothetical protein
MMTERDQTVAGVPANFADLFWSMEDPPAQRAQFIRNNIDKVLTADGRTGRIRQLVDSGYPVILLTHWQSLSTQGTRLGVGGPERLGRADPKRFLATPSNG